jgi:hypothetical protein
MPGAIDLPGSREFRMKQRSRSGWLIVLLAAIGIACALGLGVVGYWNYATSVPPFTPQLPPLPKPNGYERAATAAARASRAKRPPYPPRWPNGTQAELRAQLAPVRPILDEIRSTFRLDWRAPPERGLQAGAAFPDYASFRGRARDFTAETVVARRGGDYDAAMQRSLDGMELAAKLPWGGPLTARLVGLACHAMGFSQVERVVPHLPATAISEALTRVRRVRNAWPPLSETWENERIMTLSLQRDAFLDLPRHPLREQFDTLRSLQEKPTFRGTVQLALTPRRVVLANLDNYYRQRIDESKKPFRQRAPVPAPGDPWSGMWYLADEPEHTWKYEFAQTELAILEVALAVRLYRLERGRYPVDLRAVERRWLPTVPLDQWDQPVAYRLKDERPVVYSLGPDGKDNGGLAANVRHLGTMARGDLVFGKLNWGAWRN